MKNFTFKKGERSTGLASVARPYPDTTIKLGGRNVGVIKPPYWNSKDNLWFIMFMVEKGENDVLHNCPWKWITLTHKTETEAEAREWIRAKSTIIQEKYKLRCED